MILFHQDEYIRPGRASVGRFLAALNVFAKRKTIPKATAQIHKIKKVLFMPIFYSI